MDATELMVGGVVVGLFEENCYIVGSRRTGEAICVDPGDEVGEIRALAREMKVTISKIACSHAHLDHIMAVRALKEETGAPFLLHREDLELARQMPESAMRMLGRQERPAPDPDYFLADGDDVEIPGLSLRVIHTPGHTRAASASTAAACCSAETPCFTARSAGPICPAAAFPRSWRVSSPGC